MHEHTEDQLEQEKRKTLTDRHTVGRQLLHFKYYYLVKQHAK